MVSRCICQRCRSALASALVFLLMLWAASQCWAWGRLGHRVIAKLAERHLTDQAKAEIKALLEPGESLADCSTWADEAPPGDAEDGPLALRRCPARRAPL